MMNSKFRFKAVEVAGVSGVILLSTLGGCVTHVDGPRTGSVYVESPRETVIVTSDDYVYYPDYEVYYSRRHHHYIYQERGSWVSYREPRHVSVRVLVASPS